MEKCGKFQFFRKTIVQSPSTNSHVHSPSRGYHLRAWYQYPLLGYRSLAHRWWSSQVRGSLHGIRHRGHQARESGRSSGDSTYERGFLALHEMYALRWVRDIGVLYSLLLSLSSHTLVSRLTDGWGTLHILWLGRRSHRHLFVVGSFLTLGTLAWYRLHIRDTLLMHRRGGGLTLRSSDHDEYSGV